MRYGRSHPHFFWFITLDAVLCVALVVGGYQLFLTSSSSTETREPHELVLISPGALASQAGVENLDAFWLGPISGDKYVINDQAVGIVEIFYLPGAYASFDGKTYLYEVKTYASQGVWNVHTHPLKATLNMTSISVNKDISIKIGKSSMEEVIATFADKPEIVAIKYPRPQTLASMIKNVESLKLAR